MPKKHKGPEASTLIPAIEAQALTRAARSGVVSEILEGIAAAIEKAAAQARHSCEVDADGWIENQEVVGMLESELFSYGYSVTQSALGSPIAFLYVSWNPMDGNGS